MIRIRGHPISLLHRLNGLIRDHIRHESSLASNQRLRLMLRQGVPPNRYTFPLLLKSCVSIVQGRQIHAFLFLFGFQFDIYAMNSLISMYFRFGCIDEAFLVFDTMPHRNIITWNSVMAGCNTNQLPYASLSYFSRMMRLSSPDTFTISTVAHSLALARLGFRQGRELHAYVIRRRIRADYFENSLIHMYMESPTCPTAYAERVFWGMSAHREDSVAWTTLISGYTRRNLFTRALSTFRRLVMEIEVINGRPDAFLLVSIAPAIYNLQHGKEIHCVAVRNGYCEYNTIVSTAILHMYASLGFIDYSTKLFEIIPERNVATWTAMITSYSRHGKDEDTFRLFKEMQTQTSVSPNHLTFTGLLTACVHSGLVERAWSLFGVMIKQYGLTPDMHHCAAMVDVLGRAGRLNEAVRFIRTMPVEPNSAVWGALLAACESHWNLDLGRVVSKIILKLEPGRPGNYIFLSNMLAKTQRWDEAEKMRQVMKLKGFQKFPGLSSIHASIL